MERSASFEIPGLRVRAGLQQPNDHCGFVGSVERRGLLLVPGIGVRAVRQSRLLQFLDP